MRQLLKTPAWQRFVPLCQKTGLSILFIFTFLFSVDAENPSKIYFTENGVEYSICMDCENATDGGTIAGDETECPNPIFDPALIVNVTLPSGGTGMLEYIWIFSTDTDPFGSNAQWTPIPNTNVPEYDPGPINMTTHYRRCARREGCVEYVAESNIVSKIILCCDNVTDGGEVGSAQQGCGPTFDPNSILNITLPSGGSGNLEYQWYGSQVGPPFDPSSPDWFLIPGATGPNFDPGQLLQTTWFVRISRREGCMDFDGVSNIIEITVLDSPELTTTIETPILCFGDTTGAIDLSINGGLAPFQIEWDNGIGSVDDPQNLAAGVYSVTVTDANSCSAIYTVTLSNPDSLYIQLNSTEVSCGGMSDGLADVQIFGGTADFNIVWSNSETNDTISNLNPGTYFVTVSDQNGCEVIDSIEVTQFSDMELETTANNATCEGFSDGSATVNVLSGGTPGFTYFWNDAAGQTTQTASNLSSGEYFVTVTDANLCTAIDTILIEDGIVVEMFLSTDSVTCFGGNDGAVSIDSINGGTPNYSISWSLSGNDDLLNISNLTAGTYSVTVTDQNNCSTIDSIEIVDGYEILVDVQTENPSCLGAVNGSAFISNVSGGIPDYSYNWSPLNLPGDTINNLPPGTYSVTITDQNGCEGLGEGIVNQGQNLDIVFDSSDETCLNEGDGSAVILDVPNSTGSINFVWSNGETTPAIDSLIGGVYYIIITDSIGCIGTDSVQIASGGVMSLGITKTDVNCGNDPTGSATVNVTGGTPDYIFEWNDSANQNTQTASNLTAGMYEVVVTDAVGCTAVDSVEILASNIIDMVVEGKDVSCFGGNDGEVVVTVLTGNLTDYTIEWNTPHNQNEDLVEDLTAGIYTVTLIDSLGCSQSESVQIGEPNELNLTMTGGNPSCFGFSDGTVSVDVSGGTQPYQYFWNTSDETATVQNLPTGVYFVTVTDANGCQKGDLFQIQSPNEIQIDVVSLNETCPGSSDGSAEIMITGGTGNLILDWADPTLPDTTFVEGLTSGDYQVIVTDSKGCTGEAVASITSNSNMSLDLIGMDISCFGAQDGKASAIVSGGSGNYVYDWNVPGGSSNPIVENLASETYTVVVSDTANCSVSGMITINAPDALAVTVISNSVICEDDMNGNATTSVSGGTQLYGYLWSNGETTESLANIGIGTYYLTVTDANDCQITSSVIIEYLSDLSGTHSNQPASCFGGNDGIATVAGVAGTAPYSYEWNTGETTETISGLSSGVYFVTITDGDGCSFVETVTVGEADAIQCFANQTTPISLYGGNDGVATASASGGAGNYTYEWETDDLTPTATNLGAGTYSVTVTDENGCTCETSVTLENPSKLGDFVWKDINEDGIQDVSEPGIPNVSVTLTGVTLSGNNVNLSTSTNSNGEYIFDGLEGGSYELKFDLATNHIFSLKDEGGDNSIDSDANSIGETMTFAIAQGTVNLDWDAGMIELDEKINIGNYVWEDIDRDGIQDSTEFGVPGITVRLIDTTNNFVVASTATNLFGFYQFNDVFPGDYQIEFIKTSLPTGYTFSLPDQIADESLDSDPDTLDGKTPVFTVMPFTLDDFSWDAGIYEKCDNVTSGGSIEGNEELCGIGSDPGVIGNVNLPSGGYGGLQYLWLQSNVPVYNGPGDLNWTIIPNSNSPIYDPGPISSDTYYIRCARRVGCSDYIGESNIVSKILIEYPLTNIEEFPAQLCLDEGGKFVASIAGGGATYFWEFGTDATPETANTRTINDVSWSTEGAKPVILTVTRFGCSYSTSVVIDVVDCPGGNALIVFGDLMADLEGDEVLLTWKSDSNDGTANYVIQKAKTGDDFESLSIVKGNDSESNIYEFVDESPIIGGSEYRIKRIDTEYDLMFSETAEMFYQPEGINDVHFYPNPVTKTAVLDIIRTQEVPVKIIVSNTFAQVMNEFEIPVGIRQRELDFEDLPSGMYYITVQQDARKDYTFKIFKTN